MQCRVCRRLNCEGATDMSYVVPTDGKTFYDYFNDCTQLKATNKDDLPTILCMNCTHSLQQAYTFRQEALKSDAELKKGLALAKNETISVCDYVPDQSKVLKDIEAAPPSHLLSVSAEIETAFIREHKHSTTAQAIKAATCDTLSAQKKEECSLSNESPRQSDEVINNKSAMDPLSDQDQLNIVVKKEAQMELSNDKFEDYCENQTDGDGEYSYDKHGNRRRKPYKCDICAYKFIQKNELLKHVFELHKDTILCHQCSKIFELPEDTQIHKQLVHDTDNDMRCDWCKNSKPMPKAVLAKHLQKCHTSVYLKYFPRVRILERGEDAPFQCERCNQVFKSIYELADHIQDHIVYCQICPLTFKKVNAYKAHLKRIHNTSVTLLKANLTGSGIKKQSFPCTLCTRQFNLKKSLQKHMKMNHKNALDDGSGQDIDNTETASENDDLDECEPTKYICAYCPREFSRQKAVRLHERKIHAQVKAERKECPICQKELFASYLQTHIANVHTADRKFTCEICGNSYKTYTLLLSHKQAHFDRKFICSVCNKGFVRAHALKIHMRKHTGEEPFACHLCERRFKIRVLLNYHLQQHAGIKRKCNVCGKEYNRIEDLRIHAYSHTGMPYKCPVCDYGCAKRQKLRNHLQKKHKKTLSEDEISEIFKANTGRYSRVKLAKELGTMDEVMQETEYSN